MPAEYEKTKGEIMESMHKAHPEAKNWPETRKNAYLYETLRKRGWVKGAKGHMVKTK